jgi:hypothetical protein
MNDSSPNPKRRRRRWLLLLIAFGVVSLGIAFWDNHVATLTHAWLQETSHGTPLMVMYGNACIVPGFEDSDIMGSLLGRRQITVIVSDVADLEKLLSMPPCPVKLVVETVANTPPHVVTRLRERFGADVL